VAGHLEEIFGNYGKISNVDLVLHESVMLPLGYAYIEMSSKSECEKAIKKMDGAQLDGNYLQVAMKVVKPSNSDDRRNGGRDRRAGARPGARRSRSRSRDRGRGGGAGGARGAGRGRSPPRGGRGRSPPRGGGRDRDRPSDKRIGAYARPAARRPSPRRSSPKKA